MSARAKKRARKKPSRTKKARKPRSKSQRKAARKRSAERRRASALAFDKRMAKRAGISLTAYRKRRAALERAHRQRVDAAFRGRSQEDVVRMMTGELPMAPEVAALFKHEIESGNLDVDPSAGLVGLSQWTISPEVKRREEEAARRAGFIP